MRMSDWSSDVCSSDRAVTNFVVVPLKFLSGTFYSVDELAGPFRAAALVNPFFYLIDGFRYGMTGYADGSHLAGVAVMIEANALLARSEERGVGKECVSTVRSRWSEYH